MRSAGNFHPEWGYLAPAPSFMRTARVALVATAIGAIAGAGVVASLVARSSGRAGAGPIASHALVTTAVAARHAKPPHLAAAAAKPGKASPELAQAPVKPAVAPKLHPSAASVAAQGAGTAAPAPAASRAPLSSASAAPAQLGLPDENNTANAPARAHRKAGCAANGPAKRIVAKSNDKIRDGINDKSGRTSAATIAGPAAAGRRATAVRMTAKRYRTVPYPARRWRQVPGQAVQARQAAQAREAERAREAAQAREAREQAKQQWREDSGFGPLLRLFSFRNGAPYSSN